MGENTKIEWATHTWNPWTGCTAVSAACDHCYAEAWAKRSGIVGWGPHAERRRTSAANWRKPLTWARKAFDEGVNWIGNGDVPPRPRVFCASLADVFDNQAPQEWRDDLWNLIDATPELDWLLLTKRPQNIRKMIPEIWNGPMGLPRHIWLGATAENQTEYDRRMPHLMAVTAAVHFVSYEPALGPLQMTTSTGDRFHPDLIICGGEDRVRPGRAMDLNWARSLRDECATYGTAFFFKQTTGKGDIPADLMIRQFPHRP